MKMAKTKPVGRPTKLTDELMDKAKVYVQKDYLIDELIPTMQGLALYLGVSNKVLYNWRNENDEFLHIVEDLMDLQAKNLFRGGLTGDFNASITKLLLTKHGFSDRVEQDLRSSDGTMQPTQIVLNGVRADERIDKHD
jgi:hypothetical protein